jgi:hypothetical protein
MGVFAEYLGIRPWEIDRLTLAEFNALCKYIDDKNEP